MISKHSVKKKADKRKGIFDSLQEKIQQLDEKEQQQHEDNVDNRDWDNADQEWTPPTVSNKKTEIIADKSYAPKPNKAKKTLTPQEKAAFEAEQDRLAEYFRKKLRERRKKINFKE